MKKQVLAGALSLSMLITPAMPVWAAEALDEQTNVAIVANGDEAQVINSETAQATNGSCGAEEHESDVTWNFDAASGTLTVKGNGAMCENFDNVKVGGSRLADVYSEQIKKIVIENGVTYLAANLVRNTKNVEVDIPASVTDMNIYTNLDDSYSTFGNSYYKYDENTQECELHGIAKIVVDENNENYKVVGGVLFSKDGKILYKYTNEAAADYTVPDDVEIIATKAFARSETLHSVTLNEGLTTIGQDCFDKSHYLSGSITIPSTVTSLGGSAFTQLPNLKEITFAATDLSDYRGSLSNNTEPITGIQKVTFADGTKEIPAKTCNYLYQLKTVVFPDTVEVINANAFSQCKALESIELPENAALKEIQNNAFTNANIKSITIPNNVTKIGDSAFLGCSQLENITITPKSKLQSIGTNALCATKVKSLYIPKGVTSWGQYAFGGNAELTAVDLTANNNTVTSGGSAFWTTRHGGHENESDYALRVYYLSSEDAKDALGSNAGYSIYAVTNGGTFKTLPEGNTTLAEPEKVGHKFAGWYTDAACTDGKELTAAPQAGQTYYAKWTVADTDMVAGGYCGEELTWKLYKNNTDATNPTYKLVIKGTGEMYDYAVRGSNIAPWRLDPLKMCENITEISLPEGITSIGNNAFLKAGISTLTIPNGVTSIGENAIWNCVDPTDGNVSNVDITLPSSLKEIKTTGIFGKFTLNLNNENTSFVTTGGGKILYTKDKTKLIQVSQDYATDNLVIPDTVTEIGDFALHSCDGITGAVTLPENVKSLGKEAFFRTNITAIVLNSALEKIDKSAFRQVATLTGDLVIPKNVKEIGDSAFVGTGLTTVTFENGIENINVGIGAFASNTKAEKIALPLADVTYGKNGDHAYIFSQYNKDVNDSDKIVEPQLKTIIIGTTADNVQLSELFANSTANLETLVLGTGVTEQNALDLGKIKQGLYPSTLDVSASTNFKNVATKYTLANSTMAHGDQAAMLTLEQPANGADVSSHISYASSDESILTVDNNGMITAVGDSGSKATVTAFYDGCTFAELEVTIGKADSSTVVAPAQITATYGEDITLSATVEKKQSRIATYSAGDNKVVFKCGDTVLGTADVEYTKADKTTGTATLTYKTTDGKLPVGESTVTANYGGSVNLNGSDSNSVKVNIAAKALTIDGLTAADRTYDGTTDVELTGGSLVGVVAGDDVTAVMPKAGTVNKDAGDNKTVAFDEITLTGDKAGFYTLTQPSVTVSIAKAKLTAKYVDETINYGRTPALKVEVSGFVNGETAEKLQEIGEYTAPRVENVPTKVGKHTLTPANGSATNYEFEYKDGTLTILSTALPGGAAQTEFGITAPKADNGSIGISQKEASAGTTIIVSLTPAEGYKAGSLTVTDKNGNKLTLKSAGENKYTFTMPNSAVDIKANFVKADGSSTVDPKTAIIMQIGNKSVNAYGKTIANDVAPLIINSRTMVPIRIVTETLGGSADWNGKAQVVTLNINGKTITMKIGVVLEKYGVAPLIIDNRTYVPIRFVAEELGATVDWNADTQEIVIRK